jgi:hypothetical protein
MKNNKIYKIKQIFKTIKDDTIDISILIAPQTEICLKAQQLHG